MEHSGSGHDVDYRARDCAWDVYISSNLIIRIIDVDINDDVCTHEDRTQILSHIVEVKIIC